MKGKPILIFVYLYRVLLAIRFPFSMENIPRPRSFGCLSLKFGSILSALVIILHSVLALAQCTSAMLDIWPHMSTGYSEYTVTFVEVVLATLIYCVTLGLTALMLVGSLREKPHQIRPWIVWTSVVLMVHLLMFVFWTIVAMIHHGDSGSLLIYAVKFLGILVRFYLLMIVSSFCKQLDEDLRDGKRINTLYDNDFGYQAV